MEYKFKITQVFLGCVWMIYCAVRQFVLFIDNIICIDISSNYVLSYNDTVDFYRSPCYQQFLLCLENLRRLSSGSPTSVSTPLLTTNQNAPLKPQFDMGNIESCGLSPAALQNIREALALSLDRMKQLEYQVKLIPGLQVCGRFPII